MKRLLAAAMMPPTFSKCCDKAAYTLRFATHCTRIAFFLVRYDLSALPSRLSFTKGSCKFHLRPNFRLANSLETMYAIYISKAALSDKEEN